MSDQVAINTLNKLLSAEYESLIPRLREADPFVSWPAADDRALVEQMLADVEAHERDLTEMIIRLRGMPLPPRYSAETSSVHYIKLDYLMPAVIDSVRRLIVTYESTGATGHAETDALIARNLANYQNHLSMLEKAHSNLVKS